MDVAVEELTQVVGARVKQLRLARGLPLVRLSAEAGVSRTMLQAIEQGTANPSIGILLKLSNALNVGMPELLENPPPKVTAVLTRHDEGTVLWNGPKGGQGVMVSHADPPNVMVLWDWTLEPGESHSSDAHIDGTRELLQVQCGNLRIEHAEHAYDLGPGDSITFHGDFPHAYSNRGNASTRFLLTVVESTPFSPNWYR